ncbi:MAG: ATP-binding cassette domain-containing protein, partial [Oscillospiraceae bacterium]
MLKIENVIKFFDKGTPNERVALNNINLKINDGDFVTVIGGNGAGKSTLMGIISGAVISDSGNIFIDNEEVTLMKEYARAKMLGRVFQDPSMGTAPDMEIVENLAMAKRRGEKRGLRWGISKEEIEEYGEKLTNLDLG